MHITKERVRFEAEKKISRRTCKHTNKCNSLAIDFWVVQYGSESRYQRLADTPVAQAIVVQGNDEFSFKKLPGFESVESISVRGQDDAEVGVALAFDGTFHRG